MKTIPPLRLLLIKEGAWWTGQCLEVNVAFQFQYLSEIKEKLADALRAQLDIAKTEGWDLSEKCPPAPQRFFDMFKDAIPLELHINEVVANLVGSEEPATITETKLVEMQTVCA